MTWLLMQNPEILRMIGGPGLCELGPRSLVVQDRLMPRDPPAAETTSTVIPQVDDFSEVCLSGPLLPQPRPSQGWNLIPRYGWGWESVGVAESADWIPLGLKVGESQQSHQRCSKGILLAKPPHDSGHWQ